MHSEPTDARATGADRPDGSPATTQPAPQAGELGRDVKRSRVGVVMDVHAGQLFLRPLGGGREWEATPDEIRPLSAREELSARLAAANARSRIDRTYEQMLDREDGAIAAERMADLRAGRTEPVPMEDVARELGL